MKVLDLSSWWKRLTPDERRVYLAGPFRKGKYARLLFKVRSSR